MDSDTKRYYLHRKIKSFGADVVSREKTVEIGEELFRYPSPVFKEYLFRLNKFNYSIQSVITMKKTTNDLAKNSFVTPALLSEKFAYASRRLAELETISLSLKVNTDEQLTIAENNASETHTLIKDVDSARKLLKEPYQDTVKMIDGYCKVISDNLDRIKIRFTSEITKYKMLKEAQLKAEMDSKISDVLSIEQEKREEVDKICRIHEQLIARIYGGTYTKKDTTVVTVTGCMTSEDCDSLDSWIQLKVPAPSDFKYLPTDYEDILIYIGKILMEHKINLIEINSTSSAEYPIKYNGVLQRIIEARTVAQVKFNESKERLLKKIEKEIKSEVKSINNEVDDASKGVRNRITFEITDEVLVTRDFLSVDPSKIYNYINDNKEQLKEKIAANQEIVPGIRFYIESKFITR